MPPPKVTRTILLLAVLVCPAMAAAQAVTGTILGTVRDATGAVVPGAIVTLHETATGLSRTAATNDHGDYTSPLLATGVYTIRLQAAGFKPTDITGVELDVDEKVRVDATLEIGDVADVVSVRADNPLVQRASSDLSATLVGDQIQRLPLNSRNFVQLTRTLPGVVRGVPGENIDGAGSLGWRQSSSFSANGQRNRDNNFLLDGLDNNEVWINSVAIFPNIDALDEMKVHTGIYAAEFGRSLGGVVSLLTKSGANAFRGNAFEFLRNDCFDANDWFNNRAGRPKPDLGQHQFGATLGGPIRQSRTLLLRRLPGRSRQAGPDARLDRAERPDASRRFLRAESRDLRPDDVKPVLGNVIPSTSIDAVARRIVDQLYPQANAAGRPRADRPDHRQLRRQPRAAPHR